MLSNIELENILIYAFRKSLKDYYIKHKHGMMLMEFDTFTDKDIIELVPISLFSFNLNETCNLIAKNLNDEIIIKDFNGTTFNNIELENIIFNSIKKATKDLYIKYSDEKTINEYDDSTYKKVDELISCGIDSCYMEEIIKSMSNYLNDNFEVIQKEQK